jgi:hypothetical protein
MLKNIIKTEKPLMYYYPDSNLPTDECIIYKHLKDGWHSYRDKKMNFKNI